MGKVNCRKFYKNYYGIDFGKEYRICHMNGNDEDNRIENLLLLPKTLFHQYHFLLHKTSGNDGFPKINFKIKECDGSFNAHGYEALKELCTVMVEIDKWRQVKSLMDKSMAERGRVEDWGSIYA